MLRYLFLILFSGCLQCSKGKSHSGWRGSFFDGDVRSCGSFMLQKFRVIHNANLFGHFGSGRWDLNPYQFTFRSVQFATSVAMSELELTPGRVEENLLNVKNSRCFLTRPKGSETASCNVMEIYSLSLSTMSESVGSINYM